MRIVSTLVMKHSTLNMLRKTATVFAQQKRAEMTVVCMIPLCTKLEKQREA